MHLTLGLPDPGDPWTIASVLAAPMFGSLAALLGWRLPQGRPVAVARSACDACGHTLGPAELVPIVSFVLQGGRCRHCGAAIDPFHWQAEIAALVIALSAASMESGPALAIACGLGWTLLALTVADLKFHLLPDRLTLPLLAAGPAAGWWAGGAPLAIDRAIGAAAGFGLLALVAWGYRRLRRRIGLGFGDVKLVAAGCAWTGWQGLPSILLIGAGSALLFVVARTAVTRQFAARRRFAFGPWLALAIWLVYLLGPIRF